MYPENIEKSRPYEAEGLWKTHWFLDKALLNHDFWVVTPAITGLLRSPW